MRSLWMFCVAAVLAVSCGSGSENAAPTTTVASTTTTIAPTTTVAPTTTIAPTTTVAPTTTIAPTTTVAPTTTAPAGPLGEVEILVAPDGGFLASVPSSGLWTMNVAGANWAGPPVYVLICTATDLTILTRTGTSTCDLSNLKVGMPADGAFSLSFDLRVPDDGLCIAAGDQGQVEAGGACISVEIAD